MPSPTVMQLNEPVATHLTYPRLQDPEGFVESGGWNFLDADQSDSDGEGSEEESDFEPRYARQGAV